MTQRSPVVPRLSPVDLDSVPAVDALLGRLGLGRYDRSTPAAPAGRDDLWTGSTTTGAGVFVKRLHGHDVDVRLRMRRLLAFEDFRTTAPLPGLAAPRLLGCDPDHHLVAFALVENATSGLEMLIEDSFTEAAGHQVGIAVAALHVGPPPAGAELDDSPAPLPDLELLAGLPYGMVEEASAAELDVWRLLQQDAGLQAALVGLLDRERRAPRVPIHCDLRVDQLLFTEDGPWLTDWEEFRLGDGARDVGSFAGQWLHRAVLDIVIPRGDTGATFLDATLDHRSILSRGVAKIQRLRPKVQRFWTAYRAGRPELDPGFAERAAAVAGRHLMDRLIAGANRRSRLTGIERAAAGVGRAVLLDPGRFAATVGLGPA